MALNEKYIICIIVLVAVSYSVELNVCNGLVSDGYTVPNGDIILRYGEALNITCNLQQYMVTKHGENVSSRLYFTRNGEVLPATLINVVNSTSIRLYIENHPKANEFNYYCWYWNGSMENFPIEAGPHKSSPKSEVVCLNVVSVGVPPQNVTDFSCLSRNYENLTCNWTARNNYVKTHYNLTYYLKLRASRNNKRHKRPETVETNDPFFYNCSHIQTSTIDNKMSCFWNVKTQPQYRQSHAIFYFRLNMNNTFGTNVNSFTFEHFKRVLPNPPENLTAVAISPHAIRLNWAIPLAMSNFQPGLQHRILYQCEYYEKVWQFGALITDPDKTIVKTHTFDLKNLKYAHALCDIRVSMRSKLADDKDESMWSENATTTVRTQSKIPDCPPKTDIGSFQIVNNPDNRDVYVYWQHLRDDQKNGQNFSYQIEVENHLELKPEFTKAYARFQNLSDTVYVVNIRSVNEIGYSTNKSTVVIPAQRLQGPSNFVKIEHYQENLFQLLWEPPVGAASLITNYTIFWCNNDRDRPYQCTGYLHWVTVPGDVVTYNKTLPGNSIYQFAISANSHNSSSGMMWAECTIVPNGIRRGKIRTVNINRVGSTFIQLVWELDCSNRLVGPVNGFIVFFCQIESSLKNSCIGELKSVTFEGDINLKSGVVTGLKPYTSYRLTIAFLINNRTYSEPSEPVYNVTNEAAPATPPQNISVSNVTNSTISLNWQPPEVTNGVLKKYLIYNNGKEMTVEPDKTEITLKNLMSYENYSITVKACTVLCSKESPPLDVTTSMWLPGEINRPNIFYPNDSHIIFEWEPPVPARGKLDYYQVEITQEFNSKTAKSTLYENTTSRQISVDSCQIGKYKTLSMFVRAVNIIRGKHYPGPWSAVQNVMCPSQYMTIIYVLLGVFTIILIVGGTCCFKRVYISIKDMKNVDVELPPGLHQKVNTSDSLKSINKIGADEEFLLDKMIKGGLRSSGDSSGCSSGHESITSSLESTTHITPSDSGTEQPKSPMLSEERKHSLRQRNVSIGTRPITNKGYVLPEGVPVKPNPNPATGGSYCVLGVDPTTQPEAGSPCVPITDANPKTQLPFSCDMSQAPPPYVVTGDFIKTSNPSYVPYPPAEPAPKSTGYVVAGLTKDLVTADLLQCDTPKSTSIEEKPLYVKAAETLPNPKGVQFPWQQPAIETTLPKTGYVSVGDTPPPRTISDVTKGYVPHRQFEAKSLKED